MMPKSRNGCLFRLERYLVGVQLWLQKNFTKRLDFSFKRFIFASLNNLLNLIFMRIRPNYVPFEQAKLLKEKGFDVVCKSSYEYSLTAQKDPEYDEGGPFGWKKGELNIEYDSEFLNGSESSDYSNKNWFMCARPEQWMVVEWLRVKHGIWVSLGMGNEQLNKI
jgi:hypothetical protein